MSDTEKMLEMVRAMEETYLSIYRTHTEDSQKALDSIRARLISEAPESRPKVGRLFVKEWEYKFDDWATEHPRTSHLVMAMLREAGVIVEEP